MGIRGLWSFAGRCPETQGRVRVGLIALFLLTASPWFGLKASAGFYLPGQPTSKLVTPQGVQALPFELFKDELDATVRIGDSFLPSKARESALKRSKELLDKGARTLSSDELCELGVLQHRLREPEKSLETLTLAISRDPRNFWNYVNLGSLYQATGQLQDAANYLATANSFFPSPWPGNPSEGDWFRQAERMQLRLLRSRLREGFGRSGLRPPPVTDVDNLFEVKFVGPNGEYVAGAIDPAEKAKLPANAIAIVQQLLLWFPEDTRLFWLLGELYNAEGELENADRIFGECIWGRRFDAPALREHRRLVKEALAARVPSTPTESVIPEGPRLWIVGGFAGLILTGLFIWQIRELVRRFRRTA